MQISYLLCNYSPIPLSAMVIGPPEKPEADQEGRSALPLAGRIQSLHQEHRNARGAL